MSEVPLAERIVALTEPLQLSAGRAEIVVEWVGHLRPDMGADLTMTVVDVNGDEITVTMSADLRDALIARLQMPPMAGRPGYLAAPCGKHHLAVSEAAAGFTECEHCPPAKRR